MSGTPARRTSPILVVPAEETTTRALRRGSCARSSVRLRAYRARVTIFMLVLVVLGPALAPYPPRKLGTGLPLEGPSSHHLLGTDQLGRDVLSRILNGGTTVILVPLLAVTLAIVVGGALGLFAAYRGGSIDILITRTFDLLLSLPALLIVLVLSGLSARRPR